MDWEKTIHDMETVEFDVLSDDEWDAFSRHVFSVLTKATADIPPPLRKRFFQCVRRVRDEMKRRVKALIDRQKEHHRVLKASHK